MTPYHLARVESPALPMPSNKRVPFGWTAFPIATQTSTHFYWPQSSEEAGEQSRQSARLRITVALDVREEKRIEVLSAASERVLGVFDVRYAHALQPFELVLLADEAESARREGVMLRVVQGSEPLWCFHHTSRDCDQAHLPHLLDENAAPDPETEFFNRLLSSASLQQFGWMEGCVLDGLLDLEAVLGKARVRPVLESHLSRYFKADGALIYESPRSEVSDGGLFGIESTLPFAALASVWPQHPALDLALEFWTNRARGSGEIYDGSEISAEGSYTVAYPLAMIARVRGDKKLADLALRQLRVRRERLVTDGVVWLRSHDNGTRTFPNWARGLAWYLLGLARTLDILQDAPDLISNSDDLTAEFVRAGKFALSLQRPDGLWNCFVDDANGLVDTSGSAGIAAALAIGAARGWLDSEAHSSRTWDTLLKHLTPDGFLRDVAQSNRAGEPLQRSDYRVISPYAMGLMAQLQAAQERPVH